MTGCPWRCATLRAALGASGLSSGRASTDDRRQHESVGQPLQLPVAEVPGEEDRALPAASAARTRSSPSTSMSRGISSGDSVLMRSTATSIRPKCANVCRAIARHSASDRVGNAARSWCAARRRCAAIDAVESQADHRAHRARSGPGNTRRRARTTSTSRTRGGGAASVSVTPHLADSRHAARREIDRRADVDLERHRPRSAPAAAGAAAVASRPSRS